MRQFTFRRDGIESLPARIGSTDDSKAKPSRCLLRYDACHWDETKAVKSDDMEKCGIFELANQSRPNFHLMKPLLDRAAKSGVRHRQKSRRSIQRLWKTTLKLPRQFCLC